MHSPVWPSCEGDTASLIRAYDWSSTSLGPVDTWPAARRIMVDTMLRAPVGMAFVCGPDHVLLYNDGYARIGASRHPAMLGMTIEAAWPEARDFNHAVFTACMKGEERVFRDICFKLERNGMPADAWFDLFYSPVMDEQGQVCGVLATVIETTERMLGERQREAQRQRLRQANAALDVLRVQLEKTNRQLAGDMDFLSTLFRQSPSFIAVVKGPTHVFELANDAYMRLVQQREVLGKPVAVALPEVAAQGFVDLLDRVYQDGEAFRGRAVDVQLESGDGKMERRILDFVYQPLKDETGQTYGIFVEGIDITDHAITEERLRVAQEAGGVGTFEWYPGTGAVEVSDSYRRLWGFDPDMPITADLLVAHVEPGYRHLSGPERLGDENNPIGYSEFLIRRADTGELRWIARRGEAVTSKYTGELRYLGVVFDITERKRAEENLRQAEAALREVNRNLERKVVLEETERGKVEEALRQAQKMEAVGQLASGVAHDFNNVLQIISNNLQLLERDGLQSGPAARVASGIAAVERGAKLSAQLLAFARRQPLQPVVTHLGKLLSNMESLLLRALGDRVEVDLRQPAGLWNVEVDRNQLENAILNMAINARDAMAGMGRLAIALANAGLDAELAGEYVCLTISDTGCGMPPEVLAKIFDPFYTTKAPGKGTGLGMSMVYGFVKQSGGEIRIDSRPGAGTTIRIYLPRAHGDSDDKVDACDDIVGGRETVLVVDDDPAVVATSIEMLESLGYTVLSAGDGQQALDILRSGAPVDLLFTDLSMPGAVDCSALIAQCRQLAPGTRILVTSGHAAAEGVLDAAVDLLPKPYGRAQLARAMRQQLAPCAAPDSAATPGILVVEDDRDLRELACELLEALGHPARGCGSAEKALELLAEGTVDILFTDLHLPGMSGIDLAKRALALYPGLRVIIASGDGKHAGMPSGSGVILLPKPYDLLQLQHSIAQASAWVLN